MKSTGSATRLGSYLLVLALAFTMLGATESTSASVVEVTKDVPYGDRDGVPLLLDAYRSPTAAELPVLILVHGGSWRSGDKERWAELASAFVAEGYTVLVPNYRLAPSGGETLFPGAVDDLGLSLAWARENAQYLGGDPSRIGMLGASAGGHLTLLAARAEGDRPDAIGVFSAPASLKRLHDEDVIAWGIRNFLGCDPVTCPGDYGLANAAKSVRYGFPPTFVSYSRQELIPRWQGLLLARKLRNNLVPHEVIELRGTRHGMGVARNVFTQAVAFMDRNL